MNQKLKINELETKNKLLENDLKLEKFPDGSMVYIVEDYDIDKEIYFNCTTKNDYDNFFIQY